MYSNRQKIAQVCISPSFGVMKVEESGAVKSQISAPAGSAIFRNFSKIAQSWQLVQIFSVCGKINVLYNWGLETVLKKLG